MKVDLFNVKDQALSTAAARYRRTAAIIPVKIVMTTAQLRKQRTGYRITLRSLFSISATPSAGFTVRASIALVVVRIASDTSP